MAKKFELRIEVESMKKALSVLGTRVLKKTMLPILQDILLEYDRERKLFSLTASDSENWVRVTCQKHDEQQGLRPWLFLDKEDPRGAFSRLCINYQTLREAIGTLPSMPVVAYVTLPDDEQGGKMVVEHTKGRFTIPVNSDGQPQDFPPMPQLVTTAPETQREGISAVCQFALEGRRLLPVIKGARTCTASDELRPVMNAVCVDVFHDHAVIVSSDGHSMFRQALNTGMGWLKYGQFAANDSAKLLVNKAVLDTLDQAFTADDEPLTVTADTQYLRFESRDTVLTSRSIEGKYPNYDSVIPQNPPHRLTLDRQELQSALRRIQVFANESSNMAIARLRDGLLHLEASDMDFSKDATEHIALADADPSLPDGFKIGFKISTMVSLLGCAQSDDVRLKLCDPSRAMLIKEEDKSSSLTLLIMPMLVNE